MSTQNKLKILVVDDLRSARKVLTGLLKLTNSNVNTEEAHDKETALEKINNIKFDVVLSDLNLCNCSGLDILKLMRESVCNKNTPFILITSDSRPIIPDLFVRNNVACFLLKPFNADELNNKILYALNEHKIST